MKPDTAIVAALLLTFAALGVWAAKVQFDYLPKAPTFAYP